MSVKFTNREDLQSFNNLADKIGEKLTETFDSNANVKIGARLVPDMGDNIGVTAIVTGLKSGQVMGMLVGEKGGESSSPTQKSFGMMESIIEI